MSRAPVTLYTTHDHWLVCPTHVLWKFRSRPCDGPECLRCSAMSGIPPQLWRYGDYLQRCLEHVDRILAPSRFTAEAHRAAGILRPIDVLNSFSAAISPANGGDGPAGRPSFVYAGRLESSKGVEDLLPVFRERPEYDLLIAGDGQLEERLRSATTAVDNIQVLGRLPHAEIGTLYRHATAVISPTVGPEAFPLVPIEAMSAGTPVISRRAGGSAEAIERTGGGRVYDRPDQLLPLLDELAGDRGLRDRLAESARTGYRKHFSEEHWMSRYFEIIRSVLAEKGASVSGSGA